MGSCVMEERDEGGESGLKEIRENFLPERTWHVSDCSVLFIVDRSWVGVFGAEDRESETSVFQSRYWNSTPLDCNS